MSIVEAKKMWCTVWATTKGEIVTHPKLRALGNSGMEWEELSEKNLIPLPAGTNLYFLPQRRAVGQDPVSGKIRVLSGLAVGAALPNGYTRLLLPAYRSGKQADVLPLFGYTAVAFRDNHFWVSAVLTEKSEFWSGSNFCQADLSDKVKHLQERFPSNRIVKKLSHCALHEGCFTAQNMFYHRWEGGLPISPSCNARCLGCLSWQSGLPSAQERIKFVPAVEEVTELAVYHLQGDRGMISFGQGCEGEPTCQAELVVQSIKEIRRKTKAGRIHINTNGSRPEVIRELADVGLNSVRVSLNSAREDYYYPYYRPVDYSFADVRKTLLVAKEKSLHLSLNLLVFPGITNTTEELEELIKLVEEHRVDKIQMRNLNIDPELYGQLFPKVKQVIPMKDFIATLKNQCPKLEIGNFTPL